MRLIRQKIYSKRERTLRISRQKIYSSYPYIKACGNGKYRIKRFSTLTLEQREYASIAHRISNTFRGIGGGVANKLGIETQTGLKMQLANARSTSKNLTSKLNPHLEGAQSAESHLSDLNKGINRYDNKIVNRQETISALEGNLNDRVAEVQKQNPNGQPTADKISNPNSSYYDQSFKNAQDILGEHKSVLSDLKNKQLELKMDRQNTQGSLNYHNRHIGEIQGDISKNNAAIDQFKSKIKARESTTSSGTTGGSTTSSGTTGGSTTSSGTTGGSTTPETPTTTTTEGENGGDKKGMGWGTKLGIGAGVGALGLMGYGVYKAGDTADKVVDGTIDAGKNAVGNMTR